MNQETDLQEALRKLAASLPREAGVAAETRLLASFRTKHRQKRFARIAWSGAAVCLLLAVGWLSVHRRPQRVSPGMTVAQGRDVTSGFMPLPYAQSDVPLEDLVIVRMKLRPAELSRLGISISAIKTGSHVSADLLIGQDGMPRAVRVIQ
jgi:hypothetical protein